VSQKSSHLLTLGNFVTS